MKQITNFILEKLHLGRNSNIKESDPNDPSTWQVGDILAGTFGYNMILPRFYKIIKRTAKMFTCVRIPGKIVSGHRNGQWEEIADENGKEYDEEIRAKLTKSGGLKVDNVYVHLWDGKPLYGDDMD